MPGNNIDYYLQEISSNDKIMWSLINNHPKFSVVKSLTPFYDLIRSIISQQLSSKAAKTIHGRFIELMGSSYNAEELYIMDIERIRSVGISYQKCNYIKNVAAKLIEKSNYFILLKSNTDEEVIKELTSIKGVGTWTAQMFLMFSLGRLDVLPLGDIGIQNAVQKLYGLKSKPDSNQLKIIASKWKPYRTIGCWYLWQALDA